MIKVQNLNKSFSHKPILKNLNFEISPGEIVGFIGRNGAGKSTTMKILTGFLKPDTGSVVVENYNVLQEAKIAQKYIGYLPEANPLYMHLPVLESLIFVAQLRNIAPQNIQNKLSQVIHQCKIETVLEQKIDTLSKGFKQRVGLAQTLIHDPKVLILDEPTAGLDPHQIQDFRQILKNMSQDKTILLSTHILSEVESICQRVIIIEQGQIVADENLQKILQTESLEQKFLTLTNHHANNN